VTQILYNSIQLQQHRSGTYWVKMAHKFPLGDFKRKQVACVVAKQLNMIFSLPKWQPQSLAKSHLTGHSPPASQAGRRVGPAL
jgi:hypothetical protein